MTGVVVNSPELGEGSPSYRRQCEHGVHLGCPQVVSVFGVVCHSITLCSLWRNTFVHFGANVLIPIIAGSFASK